MKNCRNLLLTSFISCVIILLSVNTFATNGDLCFSSGGLSAGMAGSGVALTQDILNSTNNPAALFGTKDWLDIGLSLFNPHPKYSARGAGNAAQGAHYSRNNIHILPNLAYKKDFKNRQSLGLAFLSQGGMCTDYPRSFNVFGAGRTGINLKRFFLDVLYAKQFNQSLSFGASLILATQTIKVRGLAGFASYSRDNSSYRLSNEGTNVSVGAGVKLGTKIKLLKNLFVGAAVQPEIPMTRFRKYENLFAQRGKFNIPPTATIGFTFLPTQQTAINFDVQRVWYSQVPAMSNSVSRLLVCSQDSSKCLGGSNGAGFGWNNMNVYRLGFEWKQNSRWQYRLGYSYTQQPVSSRDVVFNILAPGVIRHHFTAGLTHIIDNKYAFSVFAMFAPRHSVSGYNTLSSTQKIKLSMYQYQIGFDFSCLK